MRHRYSKLSATLGLKNVNSLTGACIRSCLQFASSSSRMVSVDGKAADSFIIFGGLSTLYSDLSVGSLERFDLHMAQHVFISRLAWSKSVSCLGDHLFASFASEIETPFVAPRAIKPGNTHDEWSIFGDIASLSPFGRSAIMVRFDGDEYVRRCSRIPLSA